ncbi:MAG: winged helix-turn-helix transcriptional regulator, partial [Oscillospiraceae bacterium]|nr:winged helix-turn-helix transcriptional regulator [Oscillospiraceae bacterium]
AVLDTQRGTLTNNRAEISLSTLEYRLLLVFVNNRGNLLSRARLLEEIWDVAGDFVNDNTLTVYIKRLREKLEDDPQSPAVIKTVRGLGYRMD